jgi:hypothetical protein
MPERYGVLKKSRLTEQQLNALLIPNKSHQCGFNFMAKTIQMALWIFVKSAETQACG